MADFNEKARTDRVCAGALTTQEGFSVDPPTLATKRSAMARRVWIGGVVCFVLALLSIGAYCFLEHGVAACSSTGPGPNNAISGRGMAELKISCIGVGDVIRQIKTWKADDDLQDLVAPTKLFELKREDKGFVGESTMQEISDKVWGAGGRGDKIFSHHRDIYPVGDDWYEEFKRFGSAVVDTGLASLVVRRCDGRELKIKRESEFYYLIWLVTPRCVTVHTLLTTIQQWQADEDRKSKKKFFVVEEIKLKTVIDREDVETNFKNQALGKLKIGEYLNGLKIQPVDQIELQPWYSQFAKFGKTVVDEGYSLVLRRCDGTEHKVVRENSEFEFVITVDVKMCSNTTSPGHKMKKTQSLLQKTLKKNTQTNHLERAQTFFL